MVINKTVKFNLFFLNYFFLNSSLLNISGLQNVVDDLITTASKGRFVQKFIPIVTSQSDLLWLLTAIITTQNDSSTANVTFDNLGTSPHPCVPPVTATGWLIAGALQHGAIRRFPNHDSGKRDADSESGRTIFGQNLYP